MEVLELVQNRFTRMLNGLECIGYNEKLDKLGSFLSRVLSAEGRYYRCVLNCERD